MMLDRRPTGAAPLLRPVRRRPALLSQRTVRGDHIFLGQPLAHLGLLAHVRRNARLHKRPDFLPERIFFRGEA